MVKFVPLETDSKPQSGVYSPRRTRMVLQRVICEHKQFFCFVMTIYTTEYILMEEKHAVGAEREIAPRDELAPYVHKISFEHTI